MEKEDFGDFEEISDTNNQIPEQNNVPQKVRKPRDGELIGMVLQRLGGNRMDVKSTDGKIRNCRVPGRFKRVLWLRPKDVVIIQPWKDDDSKGDVVYKYNSSAINQLKKKGVLDGLSEEF